MPLIITILICTILGFLTGIGIGGGSLLILWLTLFLQQPQNIARAINLLFFLPSALIACLFRIKQGKLHLRKIFPAILGGAIGAVAFSLIGLRLDTEVLRIPFGFLLLVTGIRELFYRPRNAK